MSEVDAGCSSAGGGEGNRDFGEPALFLPSEASLEGEGFSKGLSWEPGLSDLHVLLLFSVAFGFFAWAAVARAAASSSRLPKQEEEAPAGRPDIIHPVSSNPAAAAVTAGVRPTSASSETSNRRGDLSTGPLTSSALRAAAAGWAGDAGLTRTFGDGGGGRSIRSSGSAGSRNVDGANVGLFFNSGSSVHGAAEDGKASPIITSGGGSTGRQEPISEEMRRVRPTPLPSDADAISSRGGRVDNTPRGDVFADTNGGLDGSSGVDAATTEDTLTQAARALKSMAAAESSRRTPPPRVGGDPQHKAEAGEERLLRTLRSLLADVERDLDAARVLLPECHRFRKVLGCVSEAIGLGMGARPRQALDLTESLKEALDFSRTLWSPEAFLVIMAELLADGVEDPSAMLGHCTRRLSRAVCALPEPAARSPAAAARLQLRSIAKGVTVGNGTVRSSSAAPAAAPPPAPAAAAPASTSAHAGPPAVVGTTTSSLASSSATTMDVTPISGGLAGANGMSGGSVAHSGDDRGRSPVNERAGATVPSGHFAAAGFAESGPGVGDSADPETAGDDVDEDDVSTCGRSSASGSSGDGSSGGVTDRLSVRRFLGPALTSEAAGLSDLIRRRGGLAALSDYRAIAAVLRAAAPRRQSAFHSQRARTFFEVDATDEVLGSTVPLLSTPPTRGRSGDGGGGNGSGGGGGGSGEGARRSGDGVHIRTGAGVDTLAGSETNAGGESGAGSMYVSTTCGGLFGSTKSPLLDSPSRHGVLPWPSPQDTTGVCQKLARRVEARVETMTAFASTSPLPASERRRNRRCRLFFFNVMGRRGTGNEIFERGSEIDGDERPSSARSGPAWSKHKRRRRNGGSGGLDVKGGRGPGDTEEQLYSSLGALLEAAKELLPGARDGGSAVNIVGETRVLTIKGACALDRAPNTRDTSLLMIPRRSSMCQHAVCIPRVGRKTLEGGARHEDGVLLVPDCRKLRQEMVRSTCMNPLGSIRPDYVAYAGAPIFLDGAPHGTLCVFSRRTLKDIGWSAHHTAVLRGLADAASTEMIRLCRIAELSDQHNRPRRAASESPQLKPPSPSRVPRPPGRSGGGGGHGFDSSGGPVAALPPGPRGGASLPPSPPRRMPRPTARSTSCSSDVTPSGAIAAVTPPTAGSRSSSVSNGVFGDEQGEGMGHGSGRGRLRTSGGRGGNGHGTPQCEEHLHGAASGGKHFLPRLEGLTSPAEPTPGRSAMKLEGDGSSEAPSVLARRIPAENGAETFGAAQVQAAAAGGGGNAQHGIAKKRWHQAFWKLRLRKRRFSSGGGSDDGDYGSSSSLDLSLLHAGSSNDAQVFVERSRAW